MSHGTPRTGEEAAARARLRHIYWIGGGSGAGKTTIARRIAAEHGFGVYSTDDAMAGHARRIPMADAPYLSLFMAMDMNERWVARTPQSMLETFPWFRGEGFGLIVEDLLRTAGGTGLVVEGFRLLPHLVEPLLTGGRQAVWLLPTPEFRRAAFDGRLHGWDVPRTVSDRQRARRNLFERDRMFTDRLRAEAARLALPVIELDTAMREAETTEAVSRIFGL
jgi:2-phosphoglycerate kinase